MSATSKKHDWLRSVALPALFLFAGLPGLIPGVVQALPDPWFEAELRGPDCEVFDSNCISAIGPGTPTIITAEVGQAVEFSCCAGCVPETFTWTASGSEYDGPHQTGYTDVYVTSWGVPGTYTVQVRNDAWPDPEYWFDMLVEIVPPSVPSAELLLYYSFDESSNRGLDGSGNGHQGLTGRGHRDQRDAVGFRRGPQLRRHEQRRGLRHARRGRPGSRRPLRAHCRLGLDPPPRLSRGHAGPHRGHDLHQGRQLLVPGQVPTTRRSCSRTASSRTWL
jgi:hypothetical protein